MSEQPTLEEIQKWHRYFAVQCNNSTWDLIGKIDRSVADNQSMLLQAYAAAYHWSIVGQPLHVARAQVTLAHVHALLEQGETAIQFARSSLAFFESGQGEDWDLAFAHMEVSFAAQVLNDPLISVYHYQQALTKGDAIAEEDDRQVFMEIFSKIPTL